jgi:lipoprotein-anchoring transpeptidase ErfK/SrfK
MAKGKHSRRRVGRRVLIIGLIAFGVLALIGGGSAYAAYRYDRATAARILPGVVIAGVDVGGMTRDQAKAAVAAKAQELVSRPLALTAGSQTYNMSPADLGVTAKVEMAVDQAAQLSLSYTWYSRAYHRLTNNPVNKTINLGLVFNTSQLNAFVKKTATTLTQPGQDAAISIDDKGGLSFVHAKPGKQLDTQASLKRIREALHTNTTDVTLPIKTVKPKVSDKSLGYTIVVRISQNKLYLYKGFQLDKTYPVATAMPGFTTPLGDWTIINKVANPTWVNPAPNGWASSMPATIPPGPGNPLGTRAMYLNAPGIRIHGEYDASSIGHYASHGCIRMLVKDSEQLYSIVPIGTHVLIIK